MNINTGQMLQKLGVLIWNQEKAPTNKMNIQKLRFHNTIKDQSTVLLIFKCFEVHKCISSVLDI